MSDASHSLPTVPPFPLFPLSPQQPRPLPYSPAHSMLSPMDPTAVDFRAFYPYIPNEVKHRKRTSSAQLKVLEGVFKCDTKPNAALRKDLAQRLDMSTRGVQVWFQNRRAKEKTKAAKASVVAGGESSAHGGNDNSTASPESSHQQDLNIKPDPVTPPAELPRSPSSWHNSPNGQMPRHIDPFGGRRGSLPVNALIPSEHMSAAYGPPLLDHVDLSSRRFSVDTSLNRLGINPYASLARSRNASSHGPPPISSVYLRQRHSPYYPATRPGVPHRASMPPTGDRRFSLDSRSFGFSDDCPSTSPSPSPLSPFHPPASLYSVPLRSVPLPLPGPLPSPDFQFGAPSSTPPPHVDDPIDPLSCGASRHPYDTEDESTTSSYDHFSRFGSITSVATSDAGTSACYSDVGSFPEYDVSRRSSSSSGFLNMMGELRVDPEDLHAQPEDGSSKFPTPSPTVSPSGSPHSLDGSPHTKFQMATTSSELAYALNDEQQSVLERSGDGSSASSSEGGIAFPQPGYPLSAPGSGSSLEDLHLRDRLYSYAGSDDAYPDHVGGGYSSSLDIGIQPFSRNAQVSFGIDAKSPFLINNNNDDGDIMPKEQSMLSLLGFVPHYGPATAATTGRSPSSVTSSVESLPTSFP